MVDLDGSYIVPVPKDLRKGDSRFNINSTEMMDKKRIQKDYDINSFPESTTLFKLGPVKTIRTIMVRKSDNKIMGEVVTIRSCYGRSNKLLPYGNLPRKDCP
ncbi:unnamed protein product, partial [Discosporangium mesarthrocarpum]